ncbi:MAG: hypothetical protein K0U41_04080, partial [Gammaproteobacteria bacterium]|nr:hypothetical protein [Gammaproteobacteria bacterium]
YAVRINNIAITENTACGAFVFTATEGSATNTSAASASPAITFTPAAELPPLFVLNAAASTLEVISAIDATIAVTITKQDNGEANLNVTGIISAGPCSIREITNTGYGFKPMHGSVAVARYKVALTDTRNIDATCTVNTTATEDNFSRSLTQEVIFNTVPTQVSFGGYSGDWSYSPSSTTRSWAQGVIKRDTTDNRNVVIRITGIYGTRFNIPLPSGRCALAPLESIIPFSSPDAIGEALPLNVIHSFAEEFRNERIKCFFTISADVDGDAPDSLPPNIIHYIYDFGPGANFAFALAERPDIVEIAPLFVSVTSDSPVTVPAVEDVIISVSVQKRDNSNTLYVTLPPSINSTGDVCTATLTNPARYAATAAGSVATTTYRVEINDRLITTPTTCGSFTFTATEDSVVATAGLTEIITFLPAFPPLITARIVEDETRVYFRDSLEVEIAATKQDNSSTLDVTFPSAIDSLGSVCTATLTASTLYNATTMGSVATANYNVTINDRSITSITPCGSFTFTATEDSAVADTDIAITFTPDLPPMITARVIGSAVDLPADATAIINVTATKQDNSPTLDVTFPSEIVSSGACRATLDGSTDRQYDGVIGGSSSVTVSYSVTIGLQDHCDTFTFTATEDVATGINDFASGISFVGIGMGDTDGDNITNSFDVDDDGDGLIEIATAAELNQLRDDLAGSSFSGNSFGCGGGRAGDALECNGYELVADIDLSAYNNWNPIGKNSAFTGIFEGNNHIIDNLNMQLDSGLNWGLFGSINSATLRNAHVRNVNITFSGDNSGIIDDNYFVVPSRVGGLVGYAQRGSWIINSSVTGHLVAGAQGVGGLVGFAEGVGIISSYVELEEVNATSRDVGGLVGSAQEVTIRLSYALTDKVTVVRQGGGGLIGATYDARIESSMAIMTNIITQNLGLGLSGISNYGGLIGDGLSDTLSFTAAITGNMLGDVTRSGGLVGLVSQFPGEPKTTIDDSYAITQSQTVRPGNNQYGGLVGVDSGASIIRDSYWDSTVLSPVDRRNFSTVTHGESKTTTELQSTTDFSGIYSAWGNSWCDATTNEFTTNSSSPLATIPDADANRFWHLGNSTDYPAMNCLPNNFTPAKQRAAMAKALNGESPLRN